MNSVIVYFADFSWTPITFFARNSQSTYGRGDFHVNKIFKKTLQAYTNRSRIQGGVSRKSIKESYGKNVVYRQASFFEEKSLNRKERGINIQDNHIENQIRNVRIYCLQKCCRNKRYPAARNRQQYSAEAASVCNMLYAKMQSLWYYAQHEISVYRSADCS
jgi:hypothetical protein